MHRPNAAQAVARNIEATPESLAGARSIATGDLTWSTYINPRGQAAITMSAPTITGDLLMVSYTYPDRAIAERALPAALDHFTSETLPDWNVPAPATVTITRVRGWYLSITRKPGTLLPVFNRRRMHGPNRPAWVKFEASAIRRFKDALTVNSITSTPPC